MKYGIHVLFLVLVFPSVWGIGQAPVSAGSVDGRTARTVHWLSWSEEAFARASAEEKLILLDLTAVWCHACHVMEESTYADPTVVEILNTQFIPIRVDSDERPDVESRYRSGGWPTTSILLPTGEILFQANYLEPGELEEALRESVHLYQTHKAKLLDRAEVIWDKVRQASQNRRPPESTIDEGLVQLAIQTMKAHFDPVHGGFREAPKFFEPDAITLAFRLINRSSDRDLRHMVLLTLQGQERLIDPVWGGFFRYAEKADWTNPHYEKMLDIQAWNLQNYVEAYQATGDRRYLRVAERTVGFVNRFLLDSERGGFWASQDAGVRARSTSRIPGDRYYPLDEGGRLALGIPGIDRSIYTGINGLMASSYLRVYQVLGDEPLLRIALKTLDRLWGERFRPGQGLAHVFKRGRLLGFGWLEDQVLFAHGLLDAFVSTGDRQYLSKAERLADFLLTHLEDSQGWGFFDRPHVRTDLGLLKFPAKPVEANARAALLFCDLFYLTEKGNYRRVAERTIHYLLSVADSLPTALTGLAVDRFLNYPVHIVIVGNKELSHTRALLRTGLQVYVPGKIVRLLDPRTDSLAVGGNVFPKLPAPHAFICTEQLCSAPVATPEDLSFTLADVLARVQENGGR